MRWLDLVSWAVLACGAMVYVLGLLVAAPGHSGTIAALASIILVAVVLSHVPWRNRRGRRMDQGHCPACGYDLQFAFREGCPECGWRRLRPARR